LIREDVVEILKLMEDDTASDTETVTKGKKEFSK
jgi:hypothetical protein